MESRYIQAHKLRKNVTFVISLVVEKPSSKLTVVTELQPVNQEINHMDPQKDPAGFSINQV